MDYVVGRSVASPGVACVRMSSSHPSVLLICVHKYSSDIIVVPHMLPLVPKGNIKLKYAGQLTGSGLCDHSGNLFGLTLEYVHADGAECMLLTLIKGFPMLYTWDSSGKNILHFLSLLYVFE